MARKPKATGNPPAMKRKMTPDEKVALFIEIARQLGVGETGAEFERAFNKIAHQERPNK